MKSSVKNTQNFGLVKRMYNGIKLWLSKAKLFFIRSVAHSNNPPLLSKSAINNNSIKIFVEGNWVRYVNLTDNLSFMISHDNFIKMYNDFMENHSTSPDGKEFQRFVISNRNSSESKDSFTKRNKGFEL